MALYEPGCMGVDVNFIRRAENVGIIVSRDEFMITKKYWADLDDGDEGIKVENVDWSRCNRHVKELLIKEYKMGYIVNGWQPVGKSTPTSDKFVCIQGGQAKLTSADWHTRGRVFGWYFSLFPITFLIFYMLAVNPDDRLVEFFLMTGAVNILVSAIISGAWCLFIEMPWRLRRQQRLVDEGKVQQNLNDFIEECRK